MGSLCDKPDGALIDTLPSPEMGQEGATRVRFICDTAEHTQVATSADGARRCWFVGHLLEEASANSGRRNVCRNDPAKMILGRYERRGVAALAEADGFFVAALLDAEQDVLRLFGGSGGAAALYYAQMGDQWLVSSSYRRLRESLPGARSCWNLYGVYDFLWGCHCLLDDTLDLRIKQVPDAAVVTCRGRHAEVSTPNVPETFAPLVDDQDTHERIFAATMEAVRRWSSGFENPVLLLTGGDDSRIVLAALTRLGRRVTCCMHSAVESVESALAASAARLCGQPFDRAQVGEQVVANFARYTNQIHRHAGGASELWNLGGIALRERLYAEHDVCLSGLGTSLTMKYPGAIGPQRMTREELACTLAGAWRDPDGPLPLFAEDLRERLSGSIYRRMLALVRTFPEGVEAHQFWDLHANAQRVAKWYPNGLRLNGRGIPQHAPLCDGDFSRLCLRLPWTIKRRKRFADLFLRRCMPQLAHLPTTYRWPERPWHVRLRARLPRGLTPHAFDRRRWWPLRREMPLSSKPVAEWVSAALPPHLPSVHDFIEREMSLPLDRKVIGETFRRFAEGDMEQFDRLSTLIPLLLADGFLFDE